MARTKVYDTAKYGSTEAYRGRQRKNERDKYLTKPEYERLLAAAASVSYRDYAFLATMGNLGLRVTETTLLRKEHLRQISDGIVLVPTIKRIPAADKKSGKTISKLSYGDYRKERNKRAAANLAPIPVTHAVAEFLSDLATRTESEWLFPSRRGNGPITERFGEMIFEKARHLAKLPPRYSSHSLRHYRGLTVYQQEKDIKLVQHLLRHKWMQTTQTYVHLDQSEVVRAVEEAGEVLLPARPLKSPKNNGR